MKFEVIYTDGQSEFVEADTQDDVFEKCGYRLHNPIQTIKAFIEFNETYEWKTSYERKDQQRVTAYVNVFVAQIPVASVPLGVEVEPYQSIKKHPEIIIEKERLLRIFPKGEVRVQKRFAR